MIKMLIDSDYQTLKKLANPIKKPFVICDLDVLKTNLNRVGEDLRKKNKKMRLCTKSVRVPEIVKYAEEQDFINGLFNYNSAEALFYAQEYGICDILIGYPIMSELNAEEACKAASFENVEITVIVDDTHHVDLLEKYCKKKGVHLKLLVELDVSYRFFGRHLGVLRSPLRTPDDVISLARYIDDSDNLSFRGIMGYEAQNASVGDNKFLYRWLKKRSREFVNEHRATVVSELEREGFECEVVNGGGSGCYQETASEEVITEIGIGSLLFKSHIFDSIHSLNHFDPSLFFILEIVRKPKNDVTTAFSGGYTSSGSDPAIPKPVIPHNIETIKFEEFGEVQTPFKFNPKHINLHLGDPIFCRFGKAGEPLEHFNEVNIFEGGKITGTYKTYRGLGKRFS
jgi:D-serine deaminase-like pyridoxal phosphate-dependent protein